MGTDIGVSQHKGPEAGACPAHVRTSQGDSWVELCVGGGRCRTEAWRGSCPAGMEWPVRGGINTKV